MVHLMVLSSFTFSSIATSDVSSWSRLEDSRNLVACHSECLALRRITFQLTEYLQRQRSKHGAFFAEQAFYPEASVTFQITPQQTKEHFHIPLTWSPYGYSTYRGS